MQPRRFSHSMLISLFYSNVIPKQSDIDEDKVERWNDEADVITPGAPSRRKKRRLRSLPHQGFIHREGNTDCACVNCLIAQALLSLD